MFETLAKIAVRCPKHDRHFPGCCGCEALQHAQREAGALRLRRQELMERVQQQLANKNLVIVGAK
jgi:hypothetical protein